MAGITSRSSYPGGAYESSTEGPGAGEFSFDVPGRGGGGSFVDMASALLGEGLSAARQKRKQAAERFSWERRAERKKYAPKMEAAPRSRPVMDPMRYANQARTAARNAQFARGGMGRYGEGQLAMEHQGERAFEQAMNAYPMYYQAMMA